MNIKKDRAWREAVKVVSKWWGEPEWSIRSGALSRGLVFAMARAIRRATARAVRAAKAEGGASAWRIMYDIRRGER